MRKAPWIAFALLLLGLLWAGGCGGGKEKDVGKGSASPAQEQKKEASPQPQAGAKKTSVSLMASAQGGSWYTLGVALSKILTDNVKELEGVSLKPGGGQANVVGVSDGQSELGFAHAVSSVDGWNGSPPFQKKYQDIRQVAAMHPTYQQIFTRAESKINSIEDLKGKKFNVGTKGLTGEVVMQLLLKAAGMTYSDLGSAQYLNFADGADQVKDKRLDGTVAFAVLPFATYVDLVTTADVRLMNIADDKIEAVRKMNSGFTKAVIPKGTYKGTDYDTATLMSPVNLLANKSVPDDLVYKITKALAENLERLVEVEPGLKGLQPRDLARDFGIPLHPGAAKYYKEKGWLK